MLDLKSMQALYERAKQEQRVDVRTELIFKYARHMPEAVAMLAEAKVIVNGLRADTTHQGLCIVCNYYADEEVTQCSCLVHRLTELFEGVK